MPQIPEKPTSFQYSLATIREVTVKLLRELNGNLTQQEKRELLACNDKQLLEWYERSANGNLDVYRTTLILQGHCNRPSDTR